MSVIERKKTMSNILDINTKEMVIPVSDGVLLPGMVEALRLKNLNKTELEHLEQEGAICIAVPLKQNFNSKNLNAEDFNKIGVLFEVEQIEKEDGLYKITIKILERIEIKELEISEEAVFAEYEIASDLIDMTLEETENVLGQMKEVIRDTGSYFKGAQPFIQVIDEIHDLNKLIGMVAQYMRLTRTEKYELLHIQSVKDRALKFADYLAKHREHIKLQVELAEKFTEKSNKNYREQVLREQLKVIQKELNDGQGSGNKKDYRQRIEEAQMPAEIEAIALEELSKLESQSPSSSDYNVIRNYLELLVTLPWKAPEDKEIDIVQARKILNDQHYGLDKVKERILQHLAVMKLKKDKKGSILLLVGPPGVGKTSLGKSIAEALDRKYIRLSLGGIRDEAEIRGHRRTYVGAMPGRILQTIKKAGAKNPVMILDEVDKLMSGHNGDPSSALLEVLDPEQNSTFTDHYLDAPYDLSEVFFIATANSLDTIPGPLLDRMEIIQISSYTGNEKFHIGKNHLVSEIIDEHGLSSEQLIIEDEAVQKIIDDYTVEAGVRGLKKQIAAVTRVAAEKIVSNSVEVPYIITAAMLEDILGKQVSRHNKVKEVNPPGVVTGLAWTPVGGEILFIEVTDMPGNGQIILTGKLGDVMKESARISLSLLKSRLAVNSFNFKEKDLHIHVPAGATPKDGPSAGIALTTALASLITGISVDSKLAMTGEITLRGSVLPIGGLKEKLFGAVRAGIKKVLIPVDNTADLKDVPSEIKDQLTIVPVETIEDVLRETLGITMPKAENVISEEFSVGAFFK
jgi:ATP-dependent Lon protease